jgi:hypothetical protein
LRETARWRSIGILLKAPTAKHTLAEKMKIGMEGSRPIEEKIGRIINTTVPFLD